jgi:DNA-binding MarR family transcriptional regulator
MSNQLSILHKCLYFTANSLARAVTRMAEEEFAVTGISPSYAFLLMLVEAKPGIKPSELAHELNLAPSTVTRFIDKLVAKGFLERQISGKTSQIYPTNKCHQAQVAIYTAWHHLFERYSLMLGLEDSRQLTQLIDQASQKLDR